MEAGDGSCTGSRSCTCTLQAPHAQGEGPRWASAAPLACITQPMTVWQQHLSCRSSSVCQQCIACCTCVCMAHGVQSACRVSKSSEAAPTYPTCRPTPGISDTLDQAAKTRVLACTSASAHPASTYVCIALCPITALPVLATLAQQTNHHQYLRHRCCCQTMMA